MDKRALVERAGLTVRATRENTIARLLADGSGLMDLPGPVLGAHPRQQRAAPDG